MCAAAMAAVVSQRAGGHRHGPRQGVLACAVSQSYEAGNPDTIQVCPVGTSTAMLGHGGDKVGVHVPAGHGKGHDGQGLVWENSKSLMREQFRQQLPNCTAMELH